MIQNDIFATRENALKVIMGRKSNESLIDLFLNHNKNASNWEIYHYFYMLYKRCPEDFDCIQDETCTKICVLYLNLKLSDYLPFYYCRASGWIWNDSCYDIKTFFKWWEKNLT